MQTTHNDIVQKERGVIAMSGGVDSSVTAALLVERGFDVVAISMRLYNTPPKSNRSCSSPDDLFDARHHCVDALSVLWRESREVVCFHQIPTRTTCPTYRRGSQRECCLLSQGPLQSR